MLQKMTHRIRPLPTVYKMDMSILRFPHAYLSPRSLLLSDSSAHLSLHGRHCRGHCLGRRLRIPHSDTSLSVVFVVFGCYPL
ncbi:hypothetical protein K474DRAFT_941699 [Panus rudis PR-1116 ss-1]|nr:hypothetical protein K474DRAFT_941699 [Panus rudis PR-1116 ss-1]